MISLGLAIDRPSNVVSFKQTALLTGKVDEQGEIPGTLTSSGAVLGIVSTILGGGIVALPSAIYSIGLGAGCLILGFGSVQVTICSLLYLKARQFCPNKPSSMFEIGYLTLGRSAIFFICIEIWIVSFFLIAIYVNIWSGTAL